MAHCEFFGEEVSGKFYADTLIIRMTILVIRKMIVIQKIYSSNSLRYEY